LIAASRKKVRGEAFGLRRSYLDLESGRIRIANNLVEVAGKLYEGPPKTKAGRRAMSLPALVVDELRLHVATYGASPYVFVSETGERQHVADWRRTIWRPAVAEAGPEPLRPHDLKHTGVALLAAAGVDPKEVSRRSGQRLGRLHARPLWTFVPGSRRSRAFKLDAIRTAGIRNLASAPS
jgi:integrase